MKKIPAQISIRPYSVGDEERLTNFLNLCFGSWGNMELWKWWYANYPGFENNNVFIQESGTEVIGHRSLHWRDLIVNGNKVLTATLGDTAIHPDYRALGMYSRLHQLTLQAAEVRGAALAVTGNRRGLITYKHNKKTGFVEIKRNPTYFRVINPERVFRKELSGFINRNAKLKEMVRNLQYDLCFTMGKAKFLAAELFGGDKQQLRNNKSKLEIIFKEASLPPLLRLKNRGKVRKQGCLWLLLLTGKVRIRFASVATLLRVAKLGFRILKYA